MKRWTFRGLRNDDGLRVVDAVNEEDARHEAMVARWGTPYGMYGNRYQGLGLILQGVEDLDESNSDRD